MAFVEGPMAQWLYRNLQDAVDRIVVCDPRPNAPIAQDGDKDDAIDAAKLAALLRGGLTTASKSGQHIPPGMALGRTAIKNSIRGVLHQQGLKLKAGQSGWSRESMAYLADLARPLEVCRAEELWRGRKGRRKIEIVAAARKLLVWAWAMLRTGRRWGPPPLSKAA